MDEDLEGVLRNLMELRTETEWVEFKEASVDFELIGKYVSALSNEANLNGKPKGWLIFGVTDKYPRKIVGSKYCETPPGLDKLKRNISQHTNHGLTFEAIHEIMTPEGRVVMFQIPPATRGIPTEWKGRIYGRVYDSLEPLTLNELERIRDQGATLDWSARVCEKATIADLDPAAIAFARQEYKKKNPHLTADVDTWTDGEFLNRAGLCADGLITNTAILLLGKSTSMHLLSPAIGQITWVLKDAAGVERDYAHFGLPLILAIGKVFEKIRNLTVRHISDETLFPLELSQYDSWVMREILHNCIAHQDYCMQGRISVVEDEESLLFSNLGSFLPQSVENVISCDAPPEYYRNQFLANAMVNLQMIDTIGSGIKRVFLLQRNRFFPMPDYDLSDPRRVRVRLPGKILDENYTRLLISKTDLSINDIIALDKVQKKKPLSGDEFARLKRSKLIEGRRPNLFVAAHIAEVTHSKADYIKHRGLDKTHYKTMVLSLLKEYGPTSRKEIDRLLMEKLPDILSAQQKDNKIRNLLQEMSRKDKSIKPLGGPGWHARWSLDED